MSAPRLRPTLAAAGVVALLAAAAGGWYVTRPKPLPPRRDDPPSVPALSSSPYLNTGPDAHYVGAAACVKCHPDEHQSYQRTGMAHSAAEVRPDREPADAAFDHPASGRRYEVHRDGSQLWHRERNLAGGKAEIVLNDFPLSLAIGSGRHGKTYAVEADGFMVESPVTYYSARRAWGMSPGYDTPTHSGFERAVGAQCLACHVGRFEVLDHSVNRFRITEPAIGCERCHGPGSLHVAKRNAADRKSTDGTEDLTIVNPRRLSRDVAEAVCQQCHLTGDLMVVARGRKSTDFRPGLPLQDVQINSRHADAGHAMTVTGHVEQMHESKCYRQSQTLTCTTCHDPHGFPEPDKKVAYYRAACVQCHAESACKVDPKKRQAESPDNSCVKCHMPTGATDIPHAAFHHHRIGVHPAPAAAAPPDPFGTRETIEPFHDLSHMNPLDRKRALGLAYGKAGAHRTATAANEAANRRALDLLSEVWKAGLRDGAVASALARANFWLGVWDVRVYAEAALRDPDLSGEDRSDMNYLLAEGEFRRGKYAEAAALLRENTTLRRDAVDWGFLSRCERAQGHEAEGLKLLETAAQIGTTIPRLRRELVDAYDKQGDRARAEWHRQRLPD